MNCNSCDSCFKICNPFQACFGEMLIKVPIGYSDPEILVKISNAQSVAEMQVIDIVDGNGPFDLSIVADGFFSAYGGPYKLEFIDTSGEIISFVATDGNNYTCIEFEFQNGSEVDSITISAFG